MIKITKDESKTRYVQKQKKNSKSLQSKQINFNKHVFAKFLNDTCYMLELMLKSFKIVAV